MFRATWYYRHLVTIVAAREGSLQRKDRSETYSRYPLYFTTFCKILVEIMRLDSDLRIARRENIDDRLVTLRVGAEARGISTLLQKMPMLMGEQKIQDFSVHETILREHSPFFRSALATRWREGQSRVIELPHDEVDVVRAYVDWLYFKVIASKPVLPPGLPIDDGEYHFLATMYGFGEKIQADEFCDDVITAMALKSDDIAQDGTRTFPSHSAVMALYSATPPGSPARRFAVDMYVDFGVNEWIPKAAELNHPDFMTDLVHAFLNRRAAASAHKQTNYPRRQEWHKRDHSREFLTPAFSPERIRRLGAS